MAGGERFTENPHIGEEGGTYSVGAQRIWDERCRRFTNIFYIYCGKRYLELSKDD